jgi:hypothetical protein
MAGLMGSPAHSKTSCLKDTIWIFTTKFFMSHSAHVVSV